MGGHLGEGGLVPSPRWPTSSPFPALREEGRGGEAAQAAPAGVEWLKPAGGSQPRNCHTKPLIRSFQGRAGAEGREAEGGGGRACGAPAQRLHLPRCALLSPLQPALGVGAGQEGQPSLIPWLSEGGGLRECPQWLGSPGQTPALLTL